MFVVMVLICLSAVSPHDCIAGTSYSLTFAGKASNPGACFMQGMAYAAAANLVIDGTYLKVVCIAPSSIGHADIA